MANAFLGRRASAIANATVFATLDSPIGELTLTARDGALSAVYFYPPTREVMVGWTRDDGARGPVPRVLADTREQLSAYFAGSLTSFDLPLATSGTDFQERVWGALREIPYGDSVSYSALARRIGTPKAFRAVGAANGQNPIPIIVPCHRVIGASGSLTGFGGGIERKRWLLNHEHRVVATRNGHLTDQLPFPW
jgi:methylated-DNA-[protein]-cysteine S-methyltransferase